MLRAQGAQSTSWYSLLSPRNEHRPPIGGTKWCVVPAALIGTTQGQTWGASACALQAAIGRVMTVIGFESRARLGSLLLAISLALLVISSLASRYSGGYGPRAANTDFWAYYFAAQTLGENPQAHLYEYGEGRNPQVYRALPLSEMGRHAAQAGIPEVRQFVYPPILADALVPLSRVSPSRAAFIWRAFNLLCMFASTLMIARAIRIRWLSFEFAGLTLAAISFYPIHEAIYFGQIMIVLLALWSLSVLAYQEGHIVLSACALAVATSLKVTPILIIPMFILWKDRKWLFSYLTTGIGLFGIMAVVNGVEILRAWGHVLTNMSGLEPSTSNKNIASVFAWIYYGRIFDTDSMIQVISAPSLMLSIASKAASGIFFLGCLYPVWRNRLRISRAEKGTVIAVLALAIITISPVSWRHAYAIAFLPLAMVWARALRQRVPLWQGLVLAVTTVSLGTLFLDGASALPLPPFAQILLASIWVLSSVAFCLTTLWSRAWTCGPTSEPSPLERRRVEPGVLLQQ